jgi:uncharacterized zinc-type alcohol dehydrogenase-like protein
MGLGGLGHLAVKLARAMGADVTVLSQSLKKRDDALRLGAGSCYATSDPETFSQLAGTFNLIVNTVSATVNVDAYLSLLAFDGVLANVGVAREPLSVNGRVLVAQRREGAMLVILVWTTGRRNVIGRVRKPTAGP